MLTLSLLLTVASVYPQDAVFRKDMEADEKALIQIISISPNIFKQAPDHVNALKKEAAQHSREYVEPGLPAAAIRIQGMITHIGKTNLSFCWTNALGICPTQEPPIAEQFKVLDAAHIDKEYFILIYDNIHTYIHVYKPALNAGMGKKEIVKYCFDNLTNRPSKGVIYKQHEKICVSLEMMQGGKETFTRVNAKWERTPAP